jgi:uncharacterized protein (DUF2147 family)
MKRFIILCGVLACCAALNLAADPVEGFWISVDEKSGKITAGWEIYQQDGKLYGKILSIAGFSQEERAGACKESYRGFPVAGNVREMRVVGTPWIFGLSREREGRWHNGSVIDPNDGNMYQCRIVFHAADGNRYKVDTLEMRGELFLGIGRSQFWQKSTQADAGGLR